MAEMLCELVLLDLGIESELHFLWSEEVEVLSIHF